MSQLLASVAAVFVFLLPAAAQGSLQELLDAAPNGSVVELEGRAYVSEIPVTLERRSGLTIQGQEGTQIICTDELADVLRLEMCTGITLRGVAAFHEVATRGCAGDVVSLDSCRDIRIEGCELNGCGVTGVQAISVWGLEIVGNDIHHNSGTGISLAKCRRVAILNNVLHENGLGFYDRSDSQVVASGNTLEGEPWSPKGSIGTEFELYWATTPEHLRALPSGVRRLSLFAFSDADAIAAELMRFEQLQELTVQPDLVSTGAFLGHLSELTQLTKLTVIGEAGMRAKMLADRLAGLEQLVELRFRASRLEQPVFGAVFLDRLLSDGASFPKLKLLMIEDDATDVTAQDLLGLGSLANLEQLVITSIAGAAVAPSWIDPLAESGKLRELKLSFASDDVMSTPLISEAAATALAGLTSLTSLELRDMCFEQDSELAFLKNMGDLEQLVLVCDPLASLYLGFKEEAYGNVAKLKKLEALTLKGIGMETDSEPSGRALMSLRKLEQLELDFLPPTDALARLPYRLTKLVLEGSLSPEQWNELAGKLVYSSLEELHLAGFGIMPTAFLASASIPKLVLRGFDLSELDWRQLSTVSRLLHFEIRGCTEVNADGRAKFQGANPACAMPN